MQLLPNDGSNNYRAVAGSISKLAEIYHQKLTLKGYSLLQDEVQSAFIEEVKRYAGWQSLTCQKAVIQRAGLDARQLKNLEKVLIPRGTIQRPLKMELMAGSVVEISQTKYMILTAAHQVETGAVGGNVGSTTKLWLASL